MVRDGARRRVVMVGKVKVAGENEDGWLSTHFAFIRRTLELNFAEEAKSSQSESSPSAAHIIAYLPQLSSHDAHSCALLASYEVCVERQGRHC